MKDGDIYKNTVNEARPIGTGSQGDKLLMEDVEWAFFEQFIAAIQGHGGRPASNHRLVLDGIFWIERTGAHWRDLPGEFDK